MSKADQTRQFIIESTATLFNKNGYSGTSLSDMTKATGLTKGSIYGNFKNKEEVAIEVFKHNSGLLAKKMENAMSLESSFYGKLTAFTEFYRNNWASMLERGGCPLLNTATEMDDALPFMKSTVRHSFTRLSDRVERLIEQGKTEGEFRENANGATYASLFIMLIEGGILLSKTFENQAHLNQALDRVLKIIDEELTK
jgi:AcrR family transcriptional regulator